MSIRVLRHWPLTAWLAVALVLAGILVMAAMRGEDAPVAASPLAAPAVGACSGDLLAVRDTLPALVGAVGDTQSLSLAAQRTAGAARRAAQVNTGAVKALLARLADQASLVVGATEADGRVRVSQVLDTADLAAAACVQPNDPGVIAALAREPAVPGAPVVVPEPSRPSSRPIATGP